MGRNLLQQYYYFWTGQKISLLGSSIVSFAIIWWITIQTQSALYLAFASIASFTPMMLVQFVSGYLTDFYNRKFILGIVDFLQALATGILIILFLFNSASIWTILVILAFRGLFDGLHNPASRAIIPTMVAEENLHQVNSHDSMAQGIINLSSPLIGGFLVVFVSNLWAILLIDLITFLIALLPLYFITIPEVEPNQTSSRSLREKLTGGFSFLRSSKGLLPLLFIYSMFNFIITPVSMLTPLIILTPAGFNETELIYSLVLMVSSASFLLMSTIMSKFKPEISNAKGVIIGFSITIIGLFCLGFSIYSNLLTLFFLGEILIGFSFPIVNIYSSIIWQTKVPAELQGRVISVRMMITLFLLPFSMGIMGIIGDIVALYLLFGVSALAFLMVLMIVWLFTNFSEIEADRVMMTREVNINSPVTS